MFKKRFTPLDWVLIGVVVAALAAGAFWFFGRKDQAAAENTAPYLLTLRFEQKTEAEYDHYKVGDILYFQNRTEELGEITALSYKNNLIETFNKETESYIVSIDKTSKYIVVEVRVDGVLGEGKFTVNGKELYIGQVFYPQTETTRSAMTVLDIEEVAE